VRWSLVAGATALLLAGCSLSSTATTSNGQSPPAQAKASSPICPLTGTPVPGGGAVPLRPALAVKVDNYPDARPQTGLDQADIVFEEPVEGMITRYVAVFQCQEPSLVGPIRSARNIDIGILGQFGKPILAHVGGIQPVISNIEASPITNLDVGDYPSIVQNVAGRVAPYDTYASTAALWGLYPNDKVPPNPVFSYSNTPPKGSPAQSISIPFSSESDVVWQYNNQAGFYVRFYGSSPDELSDGTQNAADNVVVQYVHVTYGPWYENDVGGLEVQANLYNNASGKAEIFRDGVEVTGTWSRNSLSEPTQFRSSSGAPVTLKPGNTWVELVPSYVSVTTTP
jgi:hypothetical protein